MCVYIYIGYMCVYICTYIYQHKAGIYSKFCCIRIHTTRYLCGKLTRFTYIHTHIHTCIHTYIQVSLYSCTVSVCLCGKVTRYTYICLGAHTYIHTCTDTHCSLSEEPNISSPLTAASTTQKWLHFTSTQAQYCLSYALPKLL